MYLHITSFTLEQDNAVQDQYGDAGTHRQNKVPPHDGSGHHVLPVELHETRGGHGQHRGIADGECDIAADLMPPALEQIAAAIKTYEQPRGTCQRLHA